MTTTYPRQYLLLTLSLLIGLWLLAYWSTFIDLLDTWNTKEEYSHGLLIPVITAYLIWQRKYLLNAQKIVPSWWGICILFFSGLIYFIGITADIDFLLRISLIVTLVGVTYSVFGWKILKLIFIPLLLILFSFPLPPVLQASLTAKLQLLSSQLGVSLIRFCDISVYLEGNIIDLGLFKLQVVEACSGLRYLFPLMSIAFICAYLYRVTFWKRAFIFASSIPITVAMNSLRIGVIGILVEYWGIEMAEGFIHDFEGWIVFMVCFAILFFEMWLLSWYERKTKSWNQVFAIEQNININLPACFNYSDIVSKQTGFAAFILALMVILQFSLTGQKEVIPTHKTYGQLSLNIEGYLEKPQALPDTIIKFLELTDYILVDYFKDNKTVNFYIAYYESQRKGRVPHSPKLCIPGGGWEITQLTEETINGVNLNRAIIKQEDKRQLVYYWYQQRDNSIANEYSLKWYNFLSALKYKRTDVALIRITTIVYPNEDLLSADNRLQMFMNEAKNKISQFVPL